MESGGSEGFHFSLFPDHGSANSAFIVPSSIHNVAQPFSSHLDGLLLERIAWHMPTHATAEGLSLQALDLLWVGGPCSFCQPLQWSVPTTQRSVPQETTFHQLFSSSERFFSEISTVLKDVLLRPSTGRIDENTPCAPYTFNISVKCVLWYCSNMDDWLYQLCTIVLFLVLTILRGVFSFQPQDIISVP